MYFYLFPLTGVEPKVMQDQESFKVYTLATVMQRSEKSFLALKFTLSAGNEVSVPFFPFSVHTDNYISLPYKQIITFVHYYYEIVLIIIEKPLYSSIYKLKCSFDPSNINGQVY